ncbi:MAG TPA: helix-turn-helix domain-containing protein [Pyrinomonadaceae bacterium]
MNVLSQSKLIRNLVEPSTTPLRPVTRRERRSPATRVSTLAPVTGTHVSINALKVLASSLLREIEYLEKLSESENNDEVNLKDEVCRFEAELIRSALRRTGGRQRPAARLLGTKLTTLNTKIRKYGIQLDMEW